MRNNKYLIGISVTIFFVFLIMFGLLECNVYANNNCKDNVKFYEDLSLDNSDGFNIENQKNAITFKGKDNLINNINSILNNNTSMKNAESESKIYSSSIVINAQTKDILLSENSNVKLPMASTTKIMTALVVIENCDLNEYYEIPKEAVGIEGSSIYLKEGDKWKIEDLLFGLMLRSGNDSATALAIKAGGSIDGFVTLMNNKAKELGLSSTNFTNPHGLHNENHYTTAAELAYITAEAYKYVEFSNIVSSKSHKTDKVISSTGDEIYQTFFNKNKILNSIEGGNGVKTGFTKKAGRCLVSAVKRSNMQLICVVLNKPNMWADSISLLENGFKKYTKVDICKKGEIAGYVNIKNSTDNYIEYTVKEDITFYVKNYNSSLVKFIVKTNDELIKAPIKEGTILGDVYIYYDNHLIFSTKICNIKYIAEKGEGSVLY